MSTPYVIDAKGLSKSYSLYSNFFERALDAFGLIKSELPIKHALSDVDLKVAYGEKIGIIGRNGAGKSTLLKLITGQADISTGRLTVDGDIQFMGPGASITHEDLTGMRNIENSLVYGGFGEEERIELKEDIIQFVELGEFINHPVRNYSLGMRARLDFAIATAISSEILAIDEVLGAGDGYFAHKSAERIRNLFEKSTLLLVSHGMSQIIDYCDRAIWIDDGRIIMDGAAKEIVLAYEKANAIAEAEIQEDIQSEISNPTLEIRDKIKEEWLEKDERISLLNFCVKQRALQVGELFSGSFTVRSQESLSMQPAILGYTDQGALVFEIEGEQQTVDGDIEINFECERFGVGVGKYFLIPVLMSGNKISCVGDFVVTLKVLATNWSDPPLVHLQSNWSTGDNKYIKSKISAWV